MKQLATFLVAIVLSFPLVAATAAANTAAEMHVRAGQGVVPAQADATSRTRELAEKIKAAEIRKGQGEAFDLILARTFFLLVAGWTVLRLFALRRTSERLSSASRWLLFAVAVTASVFVMAGVFLDFELGSASAFSRSGARLTADSSSMLFWIILAGRLAIATLILVVGAKALKKGSRS